MTAEEKRPAKKSGAWSRPSARQHFLDFTQRFVQTEMVALCQYSDAGLIAIVFPRLPLVA
jgi:hypothetical protein